MWSARISQLNDKDTLYVYCLEWQEWWLTVVLLVTSPIPWHGTLSRISWGSFLLIHLPNNFLSFNLSQSTDAGLYYSLITHFFFLSSSFFVLLLVEDLEFQCPERVKPRVLDSLKVTKHGAYWPVSGGKNLSSGVGQSWILIMPTTCATVSSSVKGG